MDDEDRRKIAALLIDMQHLEQYKAKYYGEGWRINYVAVENWAYSFTDTRPPGKPRTQVFEGVARDTAEERNRFFAAMRRARFTVHKHPLKTRHDKWGHRYRVQKEVDASMVMHMLAYCYVYPEITNYLVITADGDMTIPFTFVRLQHTHPLPSYLQFKPDQPIQGFQPRKVFLLHCQDAAMPEYAALRASVNHNIHAIPEDVFASWLYKGEDYFWANPEKARKR